MKDDFYTRRDSLRLRWFDYATRRIYFVTVVVEERRQVFNDSHLARAVIECLLNLRGKIRFNLYTYCLMPDHFHALIGPGNTGKTLGEICGAFKSLSTRIFWERYKGKLWQRQFFDHLIRNEEDFRESFEYIRMNPVRKNLVQKPEQWPYTGSIDIL